MDNTSRGVNGKTDFFKRSTVPSRYQQFMTSEDEAQSSSSQSSSDEEEADKKKADASVTSVTSSHVFSSVKSSVPDQSSSQVVNSAIISLFRYWNNTSV